MGKTRIISLTDAAPVEIDEDDWPLVASASADDSLPGNPNCDRTWSLFVRRHTDGRTLVYGVFTSRFTNEPGRRGGRLQPEIADIPRAIKGIANYLGFDVVLADACIADLPALRL